MAILKRDENTPEDELAPGDMMDFMRTLDESQAEQFRRIKKELRREGRESEPANRDAVRDSMFNVFRKALTKIGSGDLEHGLREALSKGDAQALRLLMQAAGIDLTEKLEIKNDGQPLQIIIEAPEEEKQFNGVLVPHSAWLMICELVDETTRLILEAMCTFSEGPTQIGN